MMINIITINKHASMEIGIRGIIILIIYILNVMLSLFILNTQDWNNYMFYLYSD